MKKVIIDFTKWRSGGEPFMDIWQDRINTFKEFPNPNCLGKGAPMLLNSEGFMCCLGFGCEQAGGVPKEAMLEIGTPEQLGREIDFFNKPSEDNIEGYTPVFLDTTLSMNAMEINDSRQFTHSERMAKLTELHAQHGIELEFINVPENLK